jgi:hypothetical protein
MGTRYEPASSAESLRLQEVVGTLLYYASAIDCTMLVALGSITAAKTTKDTSQLVTQLLHYSATNPDAVIEYKRSDMVLHVHYDASYQSKSQARSSSGGYFFLSSGAPYHTSSIIPTSKPPPENGHVHHIPSTILKVVVSSAAEAKLGALFYNAKDAAWLPITLEAMGHPQPPTPIQTDNSCATGIVNDTIKQRRSSKTIDMRFYWVHNCVQQKQFAVHWRQQGTDNLAVNFTKHHSFALCDPVTSFFTSTILHAF